MARALAEKTRAEQLGSHRVPSAAPHESMCARCGGLMVTDFCMDLLFCIGETEFAAQRCVQCGEIVDPVIIRNRGTKQEPVTAQPAGKNGAKQSRDERVRRICAADPWHRLSLCTGSRGPDPAQVGGRRGDAMRPDDHSRDTEADPPSVWVAPPTEVDRPLPTPRRGLSSR
jgi:hypothetical protein